MVVFGISALYGFVTEGRCKIAKNNFERARARAAAVPAPKRLGFPGSVFALRFGSSPAEAERACLGMARRWRLDGAVASCEAPSATNASPDIRLEFHFNALSAITLTFAPAARNLLRDYDALENGLRQSYGKPQLERAALSADCTAALAECIVRGERPKGTTWHWPAGSIELVSTQRAEAAVIELRYLRQEPGTL